MNAETLTTTDGPHPPETWAALSARMLTGPHDNGSLIARALQVEIERHLVLHFRAVQDTERAALLRDPPHVARRVDFSEDIDAALATVLNLAEPTPYQAHFAQPEVQEAVRQVLGRHMSNILHIERLWHAQRHPDDEFVQAFQQGQIL